MVLPLLIPVAASLASEFFPQLLGRIVGGRAADVAQRVVDTAAAVAGAGPGTDPQALIDRLRADPTLAEAARRQFERLHIEESASTSAGAAGLDALSATETALLVAFARALAQTLAQATAAAAPAEAPAPPPAPRPAEPKASPPATAQESQPSATGGQVAGGDFVDRLVAGRI